MSWNVERRHVLAVCVASAALLFAATVALAATGVLASAERGDIDRLTTETFADGTTLTAESDGVGAFVAESPTDADAFYNAVVRVDHGGPVLNQGLTDGIQIFHYHPLTYFLFAPLALFGYVPFKLLLLATSLLAAASGTALLLIAERDHVDVAVSNRSIAVLAVATCGIGPFLSNFKTGQVTPILYALVCLAWWAYRRDRLPAAGGALAVATLFKPYVLAPIALGFRRDRATAVLGTIGAYALATAVAAVVFGVDVLAQYYDYLLAEFLTETAATTQSLETASNLVLFDWLGPVGPLVRLVALLPLAYVGLAYLHADDDRYALGVYAATLLSIFVIVSGVSAIDLPLVVPAIVLLGLHAYDDPRPFWPAAGVFLLVHVHPTTLEVLIGNGPRFVGALAANQDVIETVVPVLQPGLYGLLGCYWLLLTYTPALPHPRELLESARTP
jgi:hypothetical protein